MWRYSWRPSECSLAKAKLMHDLNLVSLLSRKFSADLDFSSRLLTPFCSAMAPLGVTCPEHGKQGRSSAHRASFFYQRSVRDVSGSSGHACYLVLSTTVKLLDKIALSNRSCCGASLPCFHSFGSFSTFCTTLSGL